MSRKFLIYTHYQNVFAGFCPSIVSIFSKICIIRIYYYYTSNNKFCSNGLHVHFSYEHICVTYVSKHRFITISWINSLVRFSKSIVNQLLNGAKIMLFAQQIQPIEVFEKIYFSLIGKIQQILFGSECRIIIRGWLKRSRT